MIAYLIAIWKNTNRWTKVIFIVLLLQFGGFPQRKPGFYCNDPSLSHLYTGDTISWKLLLAIAILLPLVFVFAVEEFCIRFDTQTKNIVSSRKKLWLLYLEYTFGLLLDLAIVQILKVSVGEPRPHFFDVCKPDTPCEGSEFVANYKCTNTLYSEIRKSDAGRSFPSGHTSISVHAALFLVWYLEKKKTTINRFSSHYTIPSVQLLFVISAFICGISRITDRRHHWWDVLAGAIIGFSILVYTVLYLCKSNLYFHQSDSGINMIDESSVNTPGQEKMHNELIDRSVNGLVGSSTHDHTKKGVLKIEVLNVKK